MRRSAMLGFLCFPCVVLSLAIAVSSCGGGSSDAIGGTEPTIPTDPPEIDIPNTLPPKKLIVKDMHIGAGDEAEKGDEVQIRYRGLNWKNGTENSASWGFPGIPKFVLGEHRLIRGLELAIPGMKEGGSREVLVPPQLVYFPGEGPRNVRPLDALIFKVYLVRIVKKNQLGST